MYQPFACYGNRLFNRYYIYPVVCYSVCIPEKQQQIVPAQVPFKGGKG